MSNEHRSDKFFLGLLVGVGFGVAAAFLLAAGRRRATLLDEQASSPQPDVENWGGSRAERVGRGLRARIERIRTAGY